MLEGNVVLDTSVVFKFFRIVEDEEYVAEALEIQQEYLEGLFKVIVPELQIYEIGNIIRYRTNLTDKEFDDVIECYFSWGFTIYPFTIELAKISYKIAIENNVSFYDAAFISVAKENNCTFLTADRKLFKKIRNIDKIKFIGEK